MESAAVDCSGPSYVSQVAFLIILLTAAITHVEFRVRIGSLRPPLASKHEFSLRPL